MIGFDRIIDLFNNGHEEIDHIRACLPHRYIITHYDASVFVEELWGAAHKAGLEMFPADLPLVFATEDAAKVEHYQRLVQGWGWEVFDRTTGLTSEAPEATG